MKSRVDKEMLWRPMDFETGTGGTAKGSGWGVREKEV